MDPSVFDVFDRAAVGILTAAMGGDDRPMPTEDELFEAARIVAESYPGDMGPLTDDVLRGVMRECTAQGIEEWWASNGASLHPVVDGRKLELVRVLEEFTGRPLPRRLHLASPGSA